MRRKNQTILGVISAAADAMLIFVSYMLAVDLRFDVLDGVVSISMDSAAFLTVALSYALVIVLIYAAFHFYRPFRRIRPERDIGVVLAVNALGTLILMALAFTFKLLDISRWTLALFWVISSMLVILKILGVWKYRQSVQKKDQYLFHVIVVGEGKNAKQFIDQAQRQPELGFKVEGYVSSSPMEEPRQHLGTYEEIESILEKNACDEMIVALEPQEITFMPLILKAAEKEGIRVEMIPMYSEYYPTHPTLETVGETKLVNLRATPLDNIAMAAIKRGADFLASLFLLILLSPLLLVISIGVKLSSPGPVLFRQERIGKDKKPFVMLKFRSMRTDINHNGWSTKSDPRKTRFGSLIRKYSLDELPQLWNVLTGAMSLVGPRPELPVYVQQFKQTVPLYLVRQQVRPGITGWAQVNGLRGDTSIEDRVDYDIWYIQNWSLALDLKIILKTIFGGMKNEEKLV